MTARKNGNPNGERGGYERRRDRTLVIVGSIGLFGLLVAGVAVPEVGGSPLLLALVTAFSGLLVAPVVLPRRNGR